MDAIGRLFGVFLAIAAGIATALIVLPLLVFFDPLWSDAGLMASLDGFMDLLEETLGDVQPAEAVTLFASFLWTAAAMICVLPLVVVALIGEAAGVRSIVWYSGATGLLAASMPWILRAFYRLGTAGSIKPLELHLALLFFLTGTVAGFIYWLFCGRRAGLSRAGARISR